MEYRGLILIIFGCSLMMSPLAIKIARERQAEAAGPGQVETQAQADAACDEASITTRSYRLGCNHNASEVTPRRVMSGGAVFVAARH